MEVYSNIPDIIKRLEAIKAAVAPAGEAGGGIQDALFAALNSGRGLMKRRIFNNGEDATGNPMGKYRSKSYEKKRVAAGRQVEKKDLQFSGSLAASIETVQGEGNSVVIAITNAENAKIARYQEQQLKAPVFVLSQMEFDAVDEQGRRLIAEIIKEKMQ